jgi:hypothetical protein
MYRNKDKVRIIALWILHRDGVPDEDRKRLFQHARLSLGEQDAVNNLTHLGSKVVKVSSTDQWCSSVTYRLHAGGE